MNKKGREEGIEDRRRGMKRGNGGRKEVKNDKMA